MHLAMVIMALIYRYNSYGKTKCFNNPQVYDLDGHTFGEDAELFSTLSILGVCLWIVFFCGPCCVATVQPPSKEID